jgi:putative transposase
VASKKALSLPASTRRSWVKPHADYSIRRQCRLAGVTRSGFYYEPVPETAENLHLMRLIDEQYLRHPEFGYPRMTDWLREHGHKVNRKRVARLMQQMGLQAITPVPHTSKPASAQDLPVFAQSCEH